MDAETIARVFDKDTIEKALEIVNKKDKTKERVLRKLRKKNNI